MSSIRKIGNDTEIDRILNRDFVSAARSGYVEVGEDNFCLPVYYEDCNEIIKSFEVRNEDVFLLGHPKTGTTWAQEMIWLIMNDFDYDTACKIPIYLRFKQLEFPALFNTKSWFHEFADLTAAEYMAKFADDLKRFESPRCFKSHLHWSLLPEQIQNGSKQPKIINILRSPEDTCLSLYYYSQTVEGYAGNFEDFCELFLAGRICFGPFWKLVLSYWNQRHKPNMLFIKYKDMKENLPKVIQTVANFLGKSLSNEQLVKLAGHLSFESMKNNPSVNYSDIIELAKKSGLATADNAFIRSGKVGEHRSKMSSEMLARFAAWSKENLNGADLVL